MNMINELEALTDTVGDLKIGAAQKENLLRLIHGLEKQVRTYDFRLERAGKDKVSLITLLNRTAEDLDEERRKVEAATHAKSDFLAIMSHEIRTPLNAVIGMTSLLMDTNLTSAQQEFASTIRTSGDALLSIINDILDFSKIEAGRIELEKRAFNLHECVENAISLLLDESVQKGLELTYMIDPQVPVAILGDETRLRQILLNLLSNAIKFTDSGEITITVTSTKTVQLPLHELHFSVRDTGMGIPPDRMDRLFHSFSQLDSSTTRNYGGTGLGLAISKRLTELMGGTMWVESEGIKSKGSTFHFTIQVEKADKPLRSFLQSAPADLHNRRVLIVDDNATNLRILSLQTKAWGMEPRSTRIPFEALEWIRRGDSFHIAVIDQQMPQMDGLTLAKEIRKLRNEDDLPLILVSSIRGEAIEDGLFSAQLLKPVHPSQLYDALVYILSGASQVIIDERNIESVFDHDMGKRLPLRILLAEDHATNQRLALLTLERLGYRADVAANGLEVLAALDRQAYDVILMDMQMPEMDGLEATRIVRDRWPGDRGPRIIAMTANVTRKDRQACLDAGMNDYLAKPIRVDELVAALNKSQPTNRKGMYKGHKHPKVMLNRNLKQKDSSVTLKPFALDALLKLVGGDKTSFSDLIRSFLDETPPLLNRIRDAIKVEDKELLRRTAHTLKSSSLDFGAVWLSELCKQLEALGKTGNLERAMDLVTQVEAEYESTDEALKKVIARVKYV